MKKRSFVFGALILSISGIICKILGVFYKIPLANILGSEGMGVYYLIFPVYAFLITFVSNSFSLSISKNVSQSVSHGDYYEAYRIFKASLVLLLFLGLGLFVLLSCFSKVIANLQGLDMAFICYLALAPLIILVSISSAYKGYFQGLQNMVPSALSQVVAQIFKLVFAFMFAKMLSKFGVVYGTLGSFLGLGIAEVANTLFFVFYFLVFKKRNKKFFERKGEEKATQPLKNIMRTVFKSALPFILSSVILPMSLLIDSFLIVNILKAGGFDKLFATSLLGINSGIVSTLTSIPSTVSSAICMTIIPFVSYSLSKKDYEGVANKSVLAIKLSLIVALPCFLVFLFFPGDILRLLYSASFSNIYEFGEAVTLFMLSSINVFYLSILNISTSLLQSINKSYVPVVSLSLSLIFKVICEVILIFIPSLNIAGAILSNAVCYVVSATINIYFYRKYIYLKPNFLRSFVSPFVSSLACVLGVFLTKLLLMPYVSSTFLTISSLFVGGVVFIIMLFVLRTFTREEKEAILGLAKKKAKG